VFARTSRAFACTANANLEKCEQDYQRRIKEEAAGKAKAEMDAQAILQEKERLEAEKETILKG